MFELNIQFMSSGQMVGLTEGSLELIWPSLGQTNSIQSDSRTFYSVFSIQIAG